MRNALLCACVLFPGLAMAQIQGSMLNELSNRSNISVGEAAVAMLLADALGMNAQALVRDTRGYHVSVYEAAPAWWISHECHRPFADVWKSKSKGRGWGEVAHEMGIHPGTFNKMRKSGSFDQGVWMDVFRRNGIDDAEYRMFRDMGLSDRDIIMTAALGNRNSVRMREIARNRAQKGYFEVPNRGRVRAQDAWGRVPPAPGAGARGKNEGQGKSGSAPGSKGKGKGKGNEGGNPGLGHGKSGQDGTEGDKGKGKGKGKGSGNAEGGNPGQGHGKSGQVGDKGRGKGEGGG